MLNENQATDLSREKLILETAKIPWQELLRFFAKGAAISVARELDLIDVAYAFSKDQAASVEQWLSTNQIEKINDQQAQQWLEKELLVWAVIVRPWVLVQARD